ncbi:MAG TPA: hypothetical protein VFX12_00275 [Vicinamibacterales bacterium]|nr:hypothetical protein [Vicinamibacterales bacterium]
MINTVRRGTALPAVLLLTAGVCVAQTTGPARAKASANDPDMKELAAYTLTLPGVQQVDRVNRDMIASLKADPKYAEAIQVERDLSELQKKEAPSEADQKRIEALQAKQEALEKDLPQMDGDAKDLSGMAAQMEKFPPLAAALKKEGMTAREYAKFVMATMQASFAAAFQKSGQIKTLPPGINAANVKFVQDHKAELEKLQESWSELSGVSK